MARLLASESRRVTFCKVPDCRRVVSFEPGEDLDTDPDAEANGKRKTRKDRVFCKGRGCKQKYDYRRKRGWPGHPEPQRRSTHCRALIHPTSKK